MLYTISTYIDVSIIAFFIWQIRRERLAVRMRGTVFTLARLKLDSSYHQKLVSHPPDHIEALS